MKIALAAVPITATPFQMRSLPAKLRLRAVLDDELPLKGNQS
jgi:hypothetical protein